MLENLGLASVKPLFDAIPQFARISKPLDLPPACPELDLCRLMTRRARENIDCLTYDLYLGAGCYDHHVPSVIDAVADRGEFLIAYTPYQPEMSQGLLTALYDFTKKTQAMVGLPVVTSSHSDGATALAEAGWMAVCAKKRRTIVVSWTLLPQYRAVLDGYCWGREVKWSCFLGQVYGLVKMHPVCVHAAFRVSALPKYAMSGVRLSRAV